MVYVGWIKDNCVSNGISTWKIVMKRETKRRVVGGRKIERGEEGDKERE